LVTDNEHAITAVSTTTQYVAGYATLIGLHAYDNKERYREDGKWKLREIALDTGRLFFSLAVAEVAYIVCRSGLMDYLLHRDLSPTKASLLADLVSIPLYFAVAIPLAKKFRFIRQDGVLEDLTK